MKPLTTESAPDASYDELRSVIQQLHQSAETRSTRLHRTLHDELGGLMVSSAMDLAAVAMHFDQLGAVDVRLARAHKSVMAAVDMNRRLCETLRPSILDNIGLFAALRWHIKQDCEHSAAICSEQYPDQEMRLTPAATTGLYRIVQEALTLVFSEPDVKSIDLEITVDNSVLEMSITHEHVHTEPVDLFADRPEVMHALKERTRSLGGEICVLRSDAGTGLRHRFPVERIT